MIKLSTDFGINHYKFFGTFEAAFSIFIAVHTISFSTNNSSNMLVN